MIFDEVSHLPELDEVFAQRHTAHHCFPTKRQNAVNFAKSKVEGQGDANFDAVGSLAGQMESADMA
jgi:hypothetical protein